jgi:hypothetical protein
VIRVYAGLLSALRVQGRGNAPPPNHNRHSGFVLFLQPGGLPGAVRGDDFGQAHASPPLRAAVSAGPAEAISGADTLAAETEDERLKRIFILALSAAADVLKP